MPLGNSIIFFFLIVCKIEKQQKININKLYLRIMKSFFFSNMTITFVICYSLMLLHTQK